MKTLYQIRREKYDVAIACGSYSQRLARYTYMTGAKLRIGYLPKRSGKILWYNFSVNETEAPLHEVERVFYLISPLGIDFTSLPKIDLSMRVFPVANEVENTKNFLTKFKINKPLIAFHISSRKPENRWSAEKFVNLDRLFLTNFNVHIVLLWSPGSEKNPYRSRYYPHYFLWNMDSIPKDLDTIYYRRFYQPSEALFRG